MLKQESSKKQARRTQFQKIGAAISAIRATTDRDYTTGKESVFDFVIRPVNDPELSSRLFGPQTMTQQLERTIPQ